MLRPLLRIRSSYFRWIPASSTVKYLSNTPPSFLIPKFVTLRRSCLNISPVRLISESGQKSPDEKGLYKIATIPNAICLARILATPAIGYLVVSQHYTPAFGLFVIAGLSDMLDGFIARNVAGQKSLLGSVLDPIADKLLVSVMFVTLTYSGQIPVALTSVVLLRDICLIAGGFYKRFHTMEGPVTLNRFFNPQVSSIEVVPTTISKINTVLQLSVVALSLASPVFEFGENAQAMLSALSIVTAGTTVYSGIQYASGKAFKKM